MDEVKAHFFPWTENDEAEAYGGKFPSVRRPGKIAHWPHFFFLPVKEVTKSRARPEGSGNGTEL